MSLNDAVRWPPPDRDLVEALSALLDTGTSFYGRSGPILEFEERLEELTGHVHALTMSSGTAALHSAYFGAGIGPGDEVLVQAYTFFATAMPLFQLGAVPVVVDTTIFGGPDLAEAEVLLTERTKALVITHMWGIPLETQPYRDFCDRFGLMLIEDVSHAIGARSIRGTHVGDLADVAATSFQEAKNVSSGEGGALFTSDAHIHERALLLGHFNKRCLSQIGSDNDWGIYRETGVGLKYRMHGLAAAMGIASLQHLEVHLECRRRFAVPILEVIRESRAFAVWPGIAHATELSAYYALPFLSRIGSDTQGRGSLEDIAQSIGLPSLDRPVSSRSLGLHASFHFPPSVDQASTFSCVRRPTLVADWLSERVHKVSVPHQEGGAEEFIQKFKQFVSIVDELYGDECEDIQGTGFPLEQTARFRARLDGIDELVTGLLVLDRSCEIPRVLLIRRVEDDFLGGVEELPGGGVDVGESIASAMLREAREETGLALQTEICDVVSQFDYRNEWGKQSRQLNFVVEVDAEPEISVNPSEHSGYRWVPVDELDATDCTTEVRQSIQRGIGALGLPYGR